MQFNIKKKWPYIMLLMVGLSMSGITFKDWYDSKIIQYFPPAFEELTVSQGDLSFIIRGRGMGGQAILHTETGQRIQLSCGLFGGGDCYHSNMDGRRFDYSDEIYGKKAIVWWAKDGFCRADSQDTSYGRLYQVKVGDRQYLTYSTEAERYLASYKRGNTSSLVLAIFQFLIIVPLSCIKLFKEEK